MKKLLFIVLMGIGFSASAQLGLCKIETQLATVNGPDISLKFEIADEEVRVRLKDHLNYHWYRSNKVLSTEGGFDGKLLHGTYTSFYLNKNLKEQGEFHKGLKDDEWKSWFEDGTLKEITNYQKGIKDGNYKSFNNQGELVLDANYKKGLLHGEMVSYVNGKPIRKTGYKNGKEVAPKIKEEKGRKWYWPFSKKNKKVKPEPIPQKKEPETRKGTTRR